MPGRHPTSLLDLNRQGAEWRDTFANGRVHEVTGKVPQLVFFHEERAALKPVTPAEFDTDDIDTFTVNRSYRVHFDRNSYSVKPHLLGQPVLIRGNDTRVGVYLGDKSIADHERCWGAGEDIEDPEHRRAAQELKKSERGALPAGLAGLGEVGRDYLKIVAVGSRSIRREVTRLVFLVEVFGDHNTREAIDEVMRSARRCPFGRACVACTR